MKENYNYKHIKKAIEDADKVGLEKKLEGLSGYSGESLTGFLQKMSKLLNPEKEVYLEVGVFQGMTLLSVAGVNDQLECYGIDDFSCFNLLNINKNMVLERAKLNSINNFNLIESDFEDAFDLLDKKLNGKKIGLYFVDGPHDYRSQLICLEFIKPYLSNNATIVIDDSNFRHVRQANYDFIKANQEYTLLFQAYTDRHPCNSKQKEREEWWNGVNVIVRDTRKELERKLPDVERDRSLYFNDHLVHSEKYASIAPFATRFFGEIFSLNLIGVVKSLVKIFREKKKHRNTHQGIYKFMNVYTDELPKKDFNKSL
jgi:hypothetical protein